MKLPDFSDSAVDNAIECPVCGGNNLHHANVSVFDRVEDEVKTTVTTVAESGEVTVRTEDSAESLNPSRRRHGLLITFWCESNCEVPSLAVYQHKGSTYMEWGEGGR
jgi:hypothetical protein